MVQIKLWFFSVVSRLQNPPCHFHTSSRRCSKPWSSTLPGHQSNTRSTRRPPMHLSTRTRCTQPSSHSFPPSFQSPHSNARPIYTYPAHYFPNPPCTAEFGPGFGSVLMISAHLVRIIPSCLPRSSDAPNRRPWEHQAYIVV